MAHIGTWKYAMIKVKEAHGEDVCELVELYQSDDGEYKSFSKPFLTAPDDLELAWRDVSRDGINTWFFDNGNFTWNTKESFWDYKENK